MPGKRDSDWAFRPLDDELGEALRAELLSWPNMSARPVMGSLTFFRGKHMLGSYVNRALSKKKPEWLNRPGESTLVWIRLRPEDAQRALRRASVRPARLEFANWIEIPLESREMLEEAVRWFGHAYERPPRVAAKKKRGRSKHRARAKGA